MACYPDVWAPITLSIVTASASGIVGLVTIVGNAFIVMVVVIDPLKKLHTPFNYFLVNLAISDLIVGAITMPISLYVHYEETKGSLDSFLVQLLHLSYFISASASLLSLLALSVDRYVAISWAIKHRQHFTWFRCIVTSIVIWVLSLSVPFIYLKWGFLNYLMFYANSAIIVGLVVIVTIYICVYRFLRHQTREMKKHLIGTHSLEDEYNLKRVQLEKKVTRTFLVILLVYVCTYVPAILITYILHFCVSCDCTARHVLRDVIFLLISGNSCANPVICAIRLKHIRQSISTIFTKLRPERNVSDDQRSTKDIKKSNII